MEENVGYSVGRLAALSGVTVRTLHHYDRIGLLVPGERLPNGYRCYGEGDLDKLQQILFYRELGFSLDKVAAILKDAPEDRSAHLRRQHELLRDRIERLEAIVAAIEKEMEAEQMDISLTPEERFEVFGDFDPDAYAEEADQRWGDSDAFRQSQGRVAAYSKADWLRIKAESADIENRFVAALQDGAATDGERAMDLAEEHRMHISGWFYDCGHDIHQGLGAMYVADPRFSAHYEDLAAGLAQFVNDAIQANARRAGT